METILEILSEAGQTLVNTARQFTLKDALDIAIMTLLLYGAIKLVRETRAGQLVKGIVLIIALFLISHYLQLTLLNTLLSAFLQSSFIVVLILFQPEIRKALEQVGQSKVSRSLASAVGVRERESDRVRMRRAIEGVGEATVILQQMRMGALIVFERHTKLGEIAATGTIVEAEPSGQLIGNIFFNKAPLHDGAMILRDGRIYAAGCILPLTSNSAVQAELGTRHRAALGMSENSDAVVVVVSEETGQISVAISGRLRRDFTRKSLEEYLEQNLIDTTEHSGNGILEKLGLGSAGKGD